ncbi:MAG TPA: alpha/beta hydrolase, partial [Phenylobacterium sp.]
MELVPTTHGLAALSISREGSGVVVLVLHGLGRTARIEGFFPPDLTVAHLELPAHVGPLFDRYDQAAIAEAYDEVIAARFTGRRVVVVGISMGAVIGLALRAREIVALLAVDPFLDSERPALHARVRGTLMIYRPDLGGFFEELLGFHPDRIERRAYEVRCAAPTWVIAGGSASALESLTTPEDRDRLAQ